MVLRSMEISNLLPYTEKKLAVLLGKLDNMLRCSMNSIASHDVQDSVISWHLCSQQFGVWSVWETLRLIMSRRFKSWSKTSHLKMMLYRDMYFETVYSHTSIQRYYTDHESPAVPDSQGNTLLALFHSVFVWKKAEPSLSILTWSTSFSASMSSSF